MASISFNNSSNIKPAVEETIGTSNSTPDQIVSKVATDALPDKILGCQKPPNGLQTRVSQVPENSNVSKTSKAFENTHRLVQNDQWQEINEQLRLDPLIASLVGKLQLDNENLPGDLKLKFLWIKMIEELGDTPDWIHGFSQSSLESYLKLSQLLQKKYCDLALQKVWLILQEQLLLRGVDVPRKDASAAEIRNWMNDPINSKSLSEISELDLRSQELNLVPPEICKLPNLSRLDLSRNKILLVFPNQFDGLANLTILVLGENHIQQLQPDSFQGLTNLKTLILDYNQIRKLPEKIFQELPNLERLSLEHNQIQKLPEKIFHGLAKLEELSLNSNSIQKLSEKIFEGLKNLKSLLLNHNEIQELPEKIFQGLINLKIISLNNNKIRQLPIEIFRGLENLEKLRLFSNLIQELPEKIFPKQLNQKGVWMDQIKITKNNV